MAGVPRSRLLLAGVGVVILLGAIAIATHPRFTYFTWIFLGAFLIALLAALALKRYGAWLFNIGVVFLALALFEGYLNFAGERTIQTGSYTNSGYFAPDALRGYSAPQRAAAYTSTRRQRSGEVIYDVTYTIDRFGLRVTPDESPGAPAPAWFFGCSVTIGEGVEDAATLPYAFARATGRKTLNFGFHGYGPHQMLRMLETGFPQTVDARAPAVIVYNALSVHIDRSAGRTAWDKDGPRYVLADGKVMHAGRFSDRSVVMKYVDKIGTRSLVYERVLRPVLFRRQAEDRALLVAIVRQAAATARERYHARFIVVLWDVYARSDPIADDDSRVIHDELAAAGVEVVRLSTILGADDRRQFFIAGDGHPTARAFERVSGELVQRVAAKP